MAKTNLLRLALIADLEAITIANGFEITVAKVYTESVDHALRVFPSAAVTVDSGPQQGDSDVAELNNRQGIAVQIYGVELMVKSATPQADICKLLDSARNAVERTSSNLNSALTGNARVHTVDAASWDLPEDAPATMTNDFAIMNLQVRVDYSYLRGSV